MPVLGIETMELHIVIYPFRKFLNMLLFYFVSKQLEILFKIEFRSDHLSINLPHENFDF